MKLTEEQKNWCQTILAIVATPFVVVAGIYLSLWALWGMGYGVRELFGWNPTPEELMRDAAFKKCVREQPREYGDRLSCEICADKYDLPEVSLRCEDGPR